MLASGWYESRFVGTHDEALRLVYHFGHAAENDPMLTAVVMHLQTERSIRLYDNTLDLVLGPFFQNGIAPPRPVHRSMHLMSRVVLELQLRNHLLDVLRAA